MELGSLLEEQDKVYCLLQGVGLGASMEAAACDFKVHQLLAIGLRERERASLAIDAFDLHELLDRGIWPAPAADLAQLVVLAGTGESLKALHQPRGRCQVQL